MTIPPSSENGWQIIEGQLRVVWMTIPPVPDSLLEIHCGCKTGCNSQRCSCYKSTLKCTDVCRCSGCTNADVDVEDESEEEELEDTDEIDDEF